MRYELADYEWTAIKPILPNKPRGVPRVNDRHVLNGVFWVLQSGAPWRDLPEAFDPLVYFINMPPRKRTHKPDLENRLCVRTARGSRNLRAASATQRRDLVR